MVMSLCRTQIIRVFFPYTPTYQIQIPKMQAPPSTGQLSRDILLIKCLELGVVIGVAMACCSVFVFTDISHLRAPSGPKVPG